MSDSKSSSGGIGFIGLLQIVFITLKLTGHITWPWWCVLLPVLIPLGFFAALISVFVLTVAGVGLASLVSLAVLRWRSK